MAVTTLSIFRKTLRPVIFLIINKQLYRKQIRRSLAIKWHLKVKIYGSSNFGYFLSDLLSFGEVLLVIFLEDSQTCYLLSFREVLYGKYHCLDTAIILSGFQFDFFFRRTHDFVWCVFHYSVLHFVRVLSHFIVYW